MLTLADEVDVSRGDLFAARLRPAAALRPVCRRTSIWMDPEHVLPGRQYLLKSMTRIVPVQVTELKYRLDVDTLEHSAAKVLELNEIGFANLSAAAPIAFDPYAENRETGGFILIDRFTNQTVAAGMIRFALRRASNIHWQALAVDRVGACAAEAPEALRALVHRPFRLRQVDDRQSRREAALCERPPHLPSSTATTSATA